MILHPLLFELHKRFPGLVFAQNSPPEPVVTIWSGHPDIGDICIYDYGGEAALVIGKITHSHFDPYEPEWTAEQRDGKMAEDIADFLEDLFKDRVLMWVSKNGQMGGWKRLEAGEDRFGWEKDLPPDARVYLWSGPQDGSGKSA